MGQADPGEAIHPMGECEFAFPTPGGRVRLSVARDTLTLFGGLVHWAAFTKHLGMIDRRAANCPLTQTSPNAAPVYAMFQSFMLAALTDGRRLSPIERLREDPAIPEIFGPESAAHVRPGRPASILEKGRPMFRFRPPCPSLCAKTI